MKKLIVLSFLVAACAVSLAHTEVSASDDAIINQYLLLKNEYNICLLYTSPSPRD